MTAKKKPLPLSPEDLAITKEDFYRKYTGSAPRDRSFVLHPPASLSDILMIVSCGIVLAIVSGIAGALLARAC